MTLIYYLFKEYNDLEPDFTGYKNSDELAISVVEKKKRCMFFLIYTVYLIFKCYVFSYFALKNCTLSLVLQLELQIKKSKLLEKDDPLNGGPPVASIVNSNHVDDKKRKSKSNGKFLILLLFLLKLKVFTNNILYIGIYVFITNLQCFHQKLSIRKIKMLIRGLKKKIYHLKLVNL